MRTGKPIRVVTIRRIQPKPIPKPKERPADQPRLPEEKPIPAPDIFYPKRVEVEKDE